MSFYFPKLILRVAFCLMEIVSHSSINQQRQLIANGIISAFHLKNKCMGTIKNLTGENAIEKIQNLAEGKMCLMCTYENGEIVSRPMSTAQVDDNGDIWFFSPRESGKNRQIKQNNKVYLMYMEQKKQHYLTLHCTAEEVFDQEKVEELWNVFLKAWFTEGKDDPSISFIKVSPNEGHYWDEKESHLISTIKTGVAALTGTKGMDGSLQGDLSV